MSEAAESRQAQSEAEKRERSSIEFPYMGLDDAVEVAKAIHGTTGSGWCQQDQLAAALSMSMASSGFRVRLSTAKLFGLIESERGASGVRLTDLGHQVVDPSQERSAKVEAFLQVPLYKKLYEHHRGKTLPPPAALERVMAEFGVAKKQTDRARQTFDRSAMSAGFFEFGRDKLVMPAGAGAPPLPKEEEVKETGGGGGGGGAGAGGSGGGLTGHPVLDALVQTLPKSGDSWDAQGRRQWLTMVAMAFDMAYGADGAVKLKFEDPHERPRPAPN